MSTLSKEQCLKATHDGTFDSTKLELTAPLSPEDLDLLTEYLRTTKIHSLKLTLEIDQQVSQGLFKLARVIADKTELVKFHFTIEELYFVQLFSSVPILGLFDQYRRGKLNDTVFDALVVMLKKKPLLTDLSIDLEAMDQALSTEQTGSLTWNIGRSPISSLYLNFKVEPGSRLPIVDRTQANHCLQHVVIHNTEFGNNVLEHLTYTHELKKLILSKLELRIKDLAHLVKVLENNPNLGYLSLNGFNIGQFDSPIFFDQLKKCANLLILDLSECDLSRFNVDLLCEYLSSSQCGLNELDLSQNTYMSGDFEKIATALRSASKLQKLMVNNNYIESAGLKELIKLCKVNKAITTLMISGTCRFEPQDDMIDELVDFLRSPDCQLKELYFNQALSTAQFIKLAEAILHNSSLSYVNLEYPSSILGTLYRGQIRCRFNGENKSASESDTNSDAQEDPLTEEASESCSMPSESLMGANDSDSEFQDAIDEVEEISSLQM